MRRRRLDVREIHRRHFRSTSLLAHGHHLVRLDLQGRQSQNRVVLGLVHIEARCHIAGAHCHIVVRENRSLRVDVEGPMRGRELRRFEGKGCCVAGMRSWAEEDSHGLGFEEAGRSSLVLVGKESATVEEEGGKVASCSCVVEGSFAVAGCALHCRSSRCWTS